MRNKTSTKRSGGLVCGERLFVNKSLGSSVFFMQRNRRGHQSFDPSPADFRRAVAVDEKNQKNTKRTATALCVLFMRPRIMRGEGQAAAVLINSRRQARYPNFVERGETTRGERVQHATQTENRDLL